jgi:hypothetical protein
LDQGLHGALGLEVERRVERFFERWLVRERA